MAFGKENDTVSISTEAVVETVVGAQTKFKGTVNTDKPITIDGVFEGEIISSDDVFVSECGFLNGTVSCRNFKLIGKAEGKIVCSELMEFTPTGSFKGDIETKDLIVVKNAKFEGNCKIG